MGRLFQQALQLTRDRQSLLENQRLWLVQRNSSCGADPDTAVWSCLLELTKARTNSLETAIATAIEANQTSQSVPPTATITSQARAETTPVGPSVYPTNSPTSRIAQGDRARNEPPQSEGTSFPIYFAVSVLGLMIAIIAFNTVGHNRRAAAARELAAAEQERWALYVQNLAARYGEEAATRILAHEVWQGMTVDQLLESRGQPSDVGREIIREKTRETWKYHQIGRNRFRERIYLENGIVIGWKH
jgi:hypothetical protein